MLNWKGFHLSQINCGIAESRIHPNANSEHQRVQRAEESQIYSHFLSQLYNNKHTFYSENQYKLVHIQNHDYEKDSGQFIHDANAQLKIVAAAAVATIFH